MFVSELDIFAHCFQPIVEEEIKNGILIKQVENLPCQPSKAIEAMGYDHENCILYIQFKSGNTQGYYHVPLTLWQMFITTTGSVGKLYHQQIKGQFRGGRTDNLVEPIEED